MLGGLLHEFLLATHGSTQGIHATGEDGELGNDSLKFTTRKIYAFANMLGIAVPEAYRDGVITNYERLLQQAALVMAAPLHGSTDDHLVDFVP